jgi:hypothetical protein
MKAELVRPGVRDLFAAGWLGEQMFAQLGLHRAVGVLQDPSDRTRVIAESWRSERPYGVALGLGLAGASIVGLARGLDRQSRLDVAASGCALGAVAASLACMEAGRVVSHAAPNDGTPIRTGFAPMERTPPRARRAQRVLNVLAPVGMLLGAASIGFSIAARFQD